MYRIGKFIRHWLLQIREFTKFSFIPEQTYLYMACGGANLVFDLSIRYITNYYVLKGEVVKTPIHTFSADIAAFIVAFAHSFPVGFFLSKYVVWTESNLRGRKQLFRYLMVVALCFILNVGFIKFFAEVCHMNLMASASAAAVFVIFTSYMLQRFFSFKVTNEIPT
jgi:putative flippase GtrA